MNTFWIVYLAIGFLYMSTGLFLTRNMKTTVFRTVVDAVNFWLFWPYLVQVQLQMMRRALIERAQMQKFEEEYNANPEKFKQDTLDMLKKALDDAENERKRSQR
jgi:hypothetical protein